MQSLGGKAVHRPSLLQVSFISLFLRRSKTPLASLASFYFPRGPSFAMCNLPRKLKKRVCLRPRNLSTELAARTLLALVDDHARPSMYSTSTRYSFQHVDAFHKKKQRLWLHDLRYQPDFSQARHLQYAHERVL